jgi:hypothetical protein
LARRRFCTLRRARSWSSTRSCTSGPRWARAARGPRSRARLHARQGGTRPRRTRSGRAAASRAHDRDSRLAPHAALAPPSRRPSALRLVLSAAAQDPRELDRRDALPRARRRVRRAQARSVRALWFASPCDFHIGLN